MPGTYTVTYTGVCEACEGTGEITGLPMCRQCGREYERDEVDAIFDEGRGKPYPLKLPCGHTERALRDGVWPCGECEGRRTVTRQVPLQEALAALRLTAVSD